MKICIVAQTFAPQDESGAEISSRHLAANLAREHDVVVLALGLEGSEDAEPGEHPTGASYRLVRVPFRNSYLPLPRRPNVGRARKLLWHAKSAWGAVRAEDLRGFFRRERVDLIYAQQAARFLPALYDVAAEMGISVCQHLRDYALLCPRTSMFRDGQNCRTQCLTCRAATARARHASSKVGTVIAVSEFVRDRFQRQGAFPDASWHVLLNTNMSRAAFEPALLSHPRTPHEVFTFGYLGVLTREKGVEDLLRAFLALPERLNAQLVLGGRGQPNNLSRFHAIAAASPMGHRVKWLGHVPSPETVYAQSDVIVMPSLWHEPQGRVLIEAAVYRLPVIAASTGGIPEVVEAEGTGWVYSPEQPNALQELMAKAASYGSAGWQEAVPRLFPGLMSFLGTAEGTGYYERLSAILAEAAAHRAEPPREQSGGTRGPDLRVRPGSAGGSG